MTTPESLPDLLAWLDGHINLETKSVGLAPGGSIERPSLRRMAALMDALADPQHAQPVVHVTGTNGKTTTARMIASLLSAAGLATGTTTSPHLARVNERITGPAIAHGRRERRGHHDPISDDDLAIQLTALRSIEQLLTERPSWFELVTAAAFRWFADVAVDAAVVEVGMGGRWDATNVADGQVAVVTNIGLDHVEYLGPTREDIAVEKAGIVKPAATAVIGETSPDIVGLLEQEARKAGAQTILVYGRDFAVEGNDVSIGGRVVDLRSPGGEHHEIDLPLYGRHQGTNAAVALAAAEAFLGGSLDTGLVGEGFASVRSPGRLEVVGRHPLTVLDGAHNSGGAEALGRAFDEDFAGAGPVVAVLGVLQGHDPGAFLDGLGPERLRFVVACAPPSPRALDPEEVAAAAAGRGIDAIVVPEVVDAVDAARADVRSDEVLLVTGSLYVVGAARTVLLMSV